MLAIETPADLISTILSPQYTGETIVADNSNHRSVLKCGKLMGGLTVKTYMTTFKQV